jgi:hypothetical protein
MNEPHPDLLHLLTREGVLIHVSVRYPRFHKKLKPADLGLAPDQVSERFMSLGHKRLLPREALAHLALVESRTHALVDQSSFPFLGGIGHFLPNGKLEITQSKLEDLRRDFEQARDRFLAEYGQHRREALDEWRQLARQIGGSTDERERLVAHITESFPPQGVIERKFGYDIHLFQIAIPEHLSLDVVTFADQAEVCRARQEAAQAARRQIREGVEGFIGDCVTTLRHQTAQLCEEMLSSMHGGKTDGVHQKTLNRLVRFIDDFKQLNFANDTEMEHQLDRVRGELLNRSAEDYRASSGATRDLETGLSQLRDHARNLASQDARELVERFGQVGRRKLQLAS